MSEKSEKSGDSTVPISDFPVRVLFSPLLRPNGERCVLVTSATHTSVARGERFDLRTEGAFFHKRFLHIKLSKEEKRR